MKNWVVFLALFAIIFMTTDSSARRAYVTDEQRDSLAKIQTVYLSVLALTEDGRVSPDELHAIVKKRLEAIG